MKLTKFRVTHFRSVEDSGWVETDQITALIGTNESGKTNLLIPLWKLNPANDGEINAIADYPRKRYNEIRSLDEKPVFIQAIFELDDSLIGELCELTGTTAAELKTAHVQRKFDGKYIVGFPDSKAPVGAAKSDIMRLLESAEKEIGGLTTASKIDEGAKPDLLKALTTAKECCQQEEVKKVTLEKIVLTLEDALTDDLPKRSTIVPRFEQAIEGIKEQLEAASRPMPSDSVEARKLIVQHLPTFVYYSNYGNLDSEIYLPHVIQNMERDDLGSKEEAKVRTLKVLFEFVRLQPQEILELGREQAVTVGSPTEAEIKLSAEKKKEREILLQSASTELTTKFRDWWKQGAYRLRFNADGNHFRIWVSDDKRPEEIELEGRSTGLQWFLSFYLIFLVESTDAHQNAVLLLDEPGLSLHPLAQKDLSLFFENLSVTNQLLYTTHSPFLVDSDHLDRVKAVYVNQDGLTSVSANLREGLTKEQQSQSVYPVHAALGLSVSDVLLQGCQPVIVEGPSDQIYFSTIKNYLIGHQLISPKREIMFMPAGGVKGVGAVVAILTAKDEQLPVVIVDSDTPGLDMAKRLKSGIYQGQTGRVILIGEVLKLENAEVEDLMPFDFMLGVVTRFFRFIDEEFGDVAESGKPLIPQIEKFAERNGVVLELGWKVDLARRAKEAFNKRDVMKNEAELAQLWHGIFDSVEA